MKYKSLNYTQGSPEWLAFRRSRIGASDIAAIVGAEGAYSKRSDVLYEKQTGFTKPVNAFTQALFDQGHAIEEETRTEYNKAFQTNFVPAVVQSIDNEAFFASLDGFDPELETVLEIKSTRKDDYIALASDQKLPEVYSMQIQWQLFITGFNKAICVVVDSRDKTTTIVNVERDQALIDKLKTEAEVFLQEMTSGVVPYLEIETQEIRNAAAIKKQIDELELSIKEMQIKVKALELALESDCEKILKSFGAVKITGCGIVMEIKKRIGAVDYSLVPQLKNIDLNQFRKPEKQYIKITDMKGSDE